MTTPEHAVEIRHLTVKYGSFTAVDDLSFTVKTGEIFGFLGANGAGKTTAIRVMCGLLTPSSGTVIVAGCNAANETPALKERVGYLSQKFTLYDDLTVAENLDFKAALRRMPSAEARRRRGELFSFIGFSSPENTLVRALPAGVKQQVALAAAVLHDPDVLFLDEPTAGVSPAVRVQFWNLIRSLAARGKTIMVTTHYLDEAEHCGRIALMRTGQLIACDTPAGLKQNAYPDQLIEISVTTPAARAAALKILTSPDVLAFWPCGMKYHVHLKDASAARSFAARLPEGVRGAVIQPSLEDVFIHLVEGAGG